MDEFDLLLEYQLRRLLAPVVAAPVPVRRKRVDLARAERGSDRLKRTPKNLVAVPVEVVF